MKTLSNNKRAYHKYTISDTYEAGIVLNGAEVKSIKNGKMSLKESFAQIKQGEVFLIGAHISQYSKDSRTDYDPKKDRKLLLNKSEINSINSKLQKGMTLVPTKAYLKNGFIKIEIGIARAKKLFDKRDQLKKRDQKREAERELREI